MTTKQIWEDANENRELIRSIYRSICEGADISDGMDQLKSQIPSLFGVDEEERSLVFKSADDGMVALTVQEQGDSLILALSTNIELEPALGMSTQDM